MFTNMNFESLALHDSTLTDIQYEWKSHEVKIIGLLFGGKPKYFNLVFSNVSLLVVPNEQEWGPSVSINELELSSDGLYKIKMQSGDHICVKAQNFHYQTNET